MPFLQAEVCLIFRIAGDKGPSNAMDVTMVEVADMNARPTAGGITILFLFLRLQGVGAGMSVDVFLGWQRADTPVDTGRNIARRLNAPRHDASATTHQHDDLSVTSPHYMTENWRNRTLIIS